MFNLGQPHKKCITHKKKSEFTLKSIKNFRENNIKSEAILFGRQPPGTKTKKTGYLLYRKRPQLLLLLDEHKLYNLSFIRRKLVKIIA